MTHKQLGQLYIFDFYNITHNYTYKQLLQITRKACHIGRLNIVNLLGHQFSPHGESIIALLQESHFAVHTWPEHNFIAFDIYTCTPNFKIDPVLKYLKTTFKPQKIVSHSSPRGQINFT